MLKVLRAVISAICAYGLYHLPMLIHPINIIDYKNELFWPFNVDAVWYDIYKIWLYPYRFQLPLFLVCSLLFFELLDYVVQRRFYKRNKINNVLSHIIKADFFTSISESRITVYKKYSGFRSIIKYVYYCLIINRKAHKDKELLKFYKCHFPRLNRNYLWMYRRKGHPNERSTSTHFIVPKNKKEVCGIMSNAVFNENYKSIHLDSIENIDIHKYADYKKIRGTDKNRIRKYMKESMISDFDKLKSIHRLSTNIATSPIYKKDRLWGALVIDNNQEADLFNDKEGIIMPFFKVVEEFL